MLIFQGVSWLQPKQSQSQHSKEKEFSTRSLAINHFSGFSQGTRTGVPLTFVYPWYCVLPWDSWGWLTHKYPLYRPYIGISHRGTLVRVRPTIPWFRYLLRFLVCNAFGRPTRFEFLRTVGGWWRLVEPIGGFPSWEVPTHLKLLLVQIWSIWMFPKIGVPQNGWWK